MASSTLASGLWDSGSTVVAARMDGPAYAYGYSYGGTKRGRAYSCGSNSEYGQRMLSADIDSFRGKAGSYDPSTASLNQPQPKRTCLYAPVAASSCSQWGDDLQGRQVTYPGLVDNFSYQPNGGWASGSTQFEPHAAYQVYGDLSIIAVPPLNVSVNPSYTMSDERRRLQRADSVSSRAMATAFPSRSTISDESRSFRGSYNVSRTTSQRGPPDRFSGLPDQFSQISSREAASGYLPIGDLDFPTESEGYLNLVEPTFPESYDDQRSRIREYQQSDLPWSPVGLSHEPSSRPTHRSSSSSRQRNIPSSSSNNHSFQWVDSPLNYTVDLSGPAPDTFFASLEESPLETNLQWLETFPSRSEGSLLDASFSPSTIVNFQGFNIQGCRDSGYENLTSFASSRENEISNSPWNHMAVFSRPNLPSGVVALEDFPTTIGIDLSNNVPFETSSNQADPLTSLQREENENVPMTQIERTNKGDDNWQHVFVSGVSIQKTGGKKTVKESKQKVGRRAGPLNPALAKKASEMRRIGACWNCWVMKVPCSTGIVCERCRNSSYTLGSRICLRVHLADYTQLFFPPLLASSHNASAITNLMNENISAFTDNLIEVHLSSGFWYPPIVIWVNEFVPRNNEFLAVSYVSPYVNTPQPRLEKCYSPPLGIMDIDLKKMKDHCWDHIRMVIKTERTPRRAKSGQTSTLTWKVYEAVNRYRRYGNTLGNIGLIRKALMLHAIHYLMGRIIAFTKDSAENVLAHIRTPMQLPYQQSLTNRLLNRQIKHVMYKILQELTRDVLEGLEKELRTRSKASWAAAFCVSLILSICVEAVQVATDAFIVQALTKTDADTVTKATRETGIEICHSLDDLLFKHYTELFHLIYRTSRPKFGHRNERGFNPIRDGIDIDEKEGVNDATEHLVDDIRKIMKDHHEELDQKATVPKFGCKQDLLADHMRFRAENSGRLVSMFLRSFREEL